MVEVKVRCDYKACTAFTHISQRELANDDYGTFTEYPPESGWQYCEKHIEAAKAESEERP
jgi:hypothetical protein